MIDTFINILPIILGAITLWYYVKVYRPNQNKRPPKAKAQSRPSASDSITVPSASNPSTVYRIGLTALTCNCPDFQGRRSMFSVDDPRRLCKHLVKTVNDRPDIFSEYELYRSAIESAANSASGFTTKEKRNIISADGEKLAVFTENNPNEYNDGQGLWMDIFYKGQKHGYNPVKNIWTNSFRNDPGITDITRFIRKEICKYDDEFMEGL